MGACRAPEWWQNQMGISKLEAGSTQPYYNVLVDMRGGNMVVRPNYQTYVAEENIVMEKDLPPLEEEAQQGGCSKGGCSKKAAPVDDDPTIVHREIDKWFNGF